MWAPVPRRKQKEKVEELALLVTLPSPEEIHGRFLNHSRLLPTIDG